MARIREKKYSQVISAAVTEELYVRLQEEVEETDCSLSTIVRLALEAYYNIEYPETYIISIKGEDLEDLKDLGYTITRQE